MKGEIKYYGSKVAYGHDGRPLSGDKVVKATLKDGKVVTTGVADLDLMGMNPENYPVSYTL